MLASVRRSIFSIVLGDVALVMAFWMMFLNLSWLCFQRGHSSLWLGILGFCINMPFLLCPLFGVLADKYNKRRIVLLGLVLFLLPAFLLWWLYDQGQLALWSILCLGGLFGGIFAFLRPAENAMVKEVVHTSGQLHATVALTTSAIKVSQLLAAVLNGVLLLGGVLLAITGVPILIIIAYLAFYCITLQPSKPQKLGHNAAGASIGFWQGVCYILRRPGYWSILLVSAIAEMVVVSVLFQLPVFAHQHALHVSVYALNAFYLAGGLGGLLGGVIANFVLPKSTGLMKAAAGFLIVMALALLAFAIAHQLWIRLLAILVLDTSWIVIGVKCNASLQLLVDNAYRGRAMGLLLMGNIGLSPLVILLVGALSEYIGVLWTFASLSGVLCVVAIWYLCGVSRFRQNLSTTLL